jgi:gluconolactonase
VEEQAVTFPTVGSVARVDPALDAIVPAGAVIEQIATGFIFTEGPLYLPDGSLLFSDVPGNVIRRWTPEGGAVDFRRPSGYDGTDAPEGAFIGSNGLTLDLQGRVVICEHGNHRVTRLEPDGSVTVLVDSYWGRRLNSPNDAVYKSDGFLYFTDPPYGLTGQDEDPAKELDFNGVYHLTPDGTLTLLNREMTRPNGLAFSPDEQFLYVANSDEVRKVWMRFPVNADGTLGEGSVFYDVTAETAPGLPDGMKVDLNGNIYATGPGGVWIFSPEGKHLGTIQPPETPANVGWGKWTPTDAEATTLYITAETSVYRIQLNITGKRP